MKAECGRRKAEGGREDSRDFLSRRNAMTLFELLLVLVLLVVIASLATPLFESSFSSIRLRRGTDQVVACWSEARTHAIEAGRIYQFRFQPEGRNYRVDPWLGGVDPDTLERDETITTNDQNTQEEIELADWKHAEALPEGIAFSTAESVATDELGQRSVARLDLDQTTGWSAPILFFPDGSTYSASLLIKNKKKLFRRATLRALTGVARASNFLTREEVDRLQTR